MSWCKLHSFPIIDSPTLFLQHNISVQLLLQTYYQSIIMQLLKNQVNPFNGNKSKSIRSKASIFVNCLVKLCFVPITATHEKIVFTILHWKTVVNLLFLGFNLSFVFCLQLLNIKNQFNQYENDLEKTSVYILGFLAIFVRLLPLIMSNGLQNLNFRRINNGSHQSPNKHYLLSILLFIIGLFFTIVDMEDLASLPSLNIVGFLSLFTIMSVIESLYVFSLPILIQILTKDFNFSCLKASAKDNYKDVIDWYQELNKSLQLYCLCFYSYNQFTFIFNIYKNVSSFKIGSNIFRLLGKILMIVSMVLNVTDLTIALGMPSKRKNAEKETLVHSHLTPSLPSLNGTRGMGT